MTNRYQSITNKALIRAAVAVFVVIVSCTSIIFYVVMGITHEKALVQHEVYIKERVSREKEAFERIRDIHENAKESLMSHLSYMDDSFFDEEYPKLFPLKSDGTRRSVDGLFEGMALSGGRYVHGMAAFLGDGDDMPRDEQKLMLAGFEVIRAFGEASQHELDSLYFFTPDNELVIYAPDRNDHLMFYRHYAPADFNFTNEDLSQITLPENNPNRITRCTGLFPILYDQKKNVWTTGCETPVDIEGVHVGNFGTSLLLNDYLRGAVDDHLEGSYNMVWTSTGELIVHPELVERDLITPMTMNVMQTEREDFKAIWTAINNSPDKDRPFFQVETKNEILSVGRIEVPDWYFVSIYPQKNILKEAFSVALYVIYVGIAALIITPAIVGLVLNRDVSKPLHRLVGVSDRLKEGEFGRTDDALWQGLTERKDELGILSRSMQRMSETIAETFEGLEKTVRERTSALRESKEKAERVVDENSYFLAMISHDIRSPLGAIMGISEELADTDLDDEQKQYLGIIMNSSESVLELANSVLDLSKIESEGLKLEEDAFSLQKLYDDVCSLTRYMASAKGLDLKAGDLPNVLRFVGGDAKRVRQIMMNLITNAIKFTAEGEVGLKLVQSKAEGPFHWVEIQVSDTGIGIAPDKLDHIFQPYKQAEEGTGKIYGGSGLGLSIVRKLVEAMDGEIWVESELGKGSTFHARIKLKAVRMV